MRTTVSFDGTTVSLNLPRCRVLVEHSASAVKGRVIIVTDRVYAFWTGKKDAPLQVTQGNIFTSLLMHLPLKGHRTYARGAKQRKQHLSDFDVHIIVPPHVTDIYSEHISASGTLITRHTD